MPKRAAISCARAARAEQTAVIATSGTCRNASIWATPTPVPITPTRTVDVMQPPHGKEKRTEQETRRRTRGEPKEYFPPLVLRVSVSPVPSPLRPDDRPVAPPYFRPGTVQRLLG